MYIQQNSISDGQIIEAKHIQYPNRYFQIVKVLGKGGEGEVYQAEPFNWMVNYKGPVALKFQSLQQQSESEISFIKNLMDYQAKYETSQADETYQSGIIKIYDIFNWKQYQIVVMELGSADLYNYIQSIQENEQLNILKQISLSIKFLHHNQLIHRDLKPENYIRIGNVFKLIDFGLIKQAKRLQTPYKGTPLTQAPEVAEGSQQYTTSADIWSLACVFFEVMTKQPFCQINTLQEQARLLKNYKSDQSVLFNRIEQLIKNQSLKNLIKEMIHPIPEKRINIQNILAKLTQLTLQVEQQKINPWACSFPIVNPPKQFQNLQKAEELQDQISDQFPQKPSQFQKLNGDISNNISNPNLIAQIDLKIQNQTNLMLMDIKSFLQSHQDKQEQHYKVHQELLKQIMNNQQKYDFQFSEQGQNFIFSKQNNILFILAFQVIFEIPAAQQSIVTSITDSNQKIQRIIEMVSTQQQYVRQSQTKMDYSLEDSLYNKLQCIINPLQHNISKIEGKINEISKSSNDVLQKQQENLNQQLRIFEDLKLDKICQLVQSFEQKINLSFEKIQQNKEELLSKSNQQDKFLSILEEIKEKVALNYNQSFNPKNDLYQDLKSVIDKIAQSLNFIKDDKSLSLEISKQFQQIQQFNKQEFEKLINKLNSGNQIQNTINTNQTVLDDNLNMKEISSKLQMIFEKVKYFIEEQSAYKLLKSDFNQLNSQFNNLKSTYQNQQDKFNYITTEIKQISVGQNAMINQKVKELSIEKFNFFQILQTIVAQITLATGNLEKINPLQLYKEASTKQ